MKICFFFKILFFILLLMTIISCADATEPKDEKNSSWWDTSKQAVENIWQDSTQFIEQFLNSSSDNEFSQIWKNITSTLEEILVLEQENETLPDRAWLSKDKTDNNDEINKLLDEAIAILSVSNSAEIRQRIRALENQIRELKQANSQYRQAQVSAPIQSTWETTVTEYEQKIEKNIALIKQYNEEIEQLKSEFAQQLAQRHLYLTPAQLDVLLSSVVGDDIIQSSIVYDNIKKISQQLMTLTIDSGEDLNISQRYYGMYTVLLKILLHMQHSFINKIDEKYLPKIAHIMEEVQNVTYTTQNLLRRETEEMRRRHLLANLEAQQLTVKTAHLYQKHLMEQRRKIVQAQEKTRADWQIAQNTYKTVRVSGELINLLRTSQKSFDLLLNLQVPDLLAFENLQMKQEFAILTQKLAQ